MPQGRLSSQPGRQMAGPPVTMGEQTLSWPPQEALVSQAWQASEVERMQLPVVCSQLKPSPQSTAAQRSSQERKKGRH